VWRGKTVLLQQRLPALHSMTLAPFRANMLNVPHLWAKLFAGSAPYAAS
jgi:hypothetical protein